MTKHVLLAAFVTLFVVSTALAQNGVISTIPGSAEMRVTEGKESDLFVLSLSPGVVETLPGVDVVVLCDTSATMSGQYRDEQLTALQVLLGSLGSQDRVHLVACDVKAIPLTSGLLAPDSAEVTAAITKLENRVPLGSSDMKVALESAMGAFTGDSKAKVVVYLGQGTSRARIMLPKEFGDLADALASKQISVDAVAMGPNMDIVLLKTLAAKTGGNVICPAMVTDVENAASSMYAMNDIGSLPEVVRTKVYWTSPESDQMADPNIEVMYPAQMPPFRGDRDTIVIGKLKKGTTSVNLSVAFLDGMKRTYDVAPKVEVAPFIEEMVRYVEEKKGWLPLVSSADVANVMANMNNHVGTLLSLAKQSLEGEDMQLESAADLVRQAKLKAPTDPEVLKMEKVVDELLVARQNQVSGMGAPLDSGVNLSSSVQSREADIQSANVRVQNAVNSARQLMVAQPQEANTVLQQELGFVEEADLPPEVKDALGKQIRATMRQARSREEELAIREQEDLVRLNEMRERQIVLDNARTDRQRVQQLMRRFDSLMEEGKYRQAEENVAQEVLRRDPDNLAAVTGTITARNTGYVEQAMQNNIRRIKGYVDALHQVEVSHVPFPEEPPVVYPDSEEWKRLTERRVEKYKTMDLSQRSSIEKKIMDTLKEETTINATEMPLQDVIRKLKEDHGIEIQLDEKALMDLDIDPENEMVTMNVSGISLGAALRLMLSSRELMYVVEDEVLKITSTESASTSLSTRVYPVADLVLPIENISPMGGGMIGGGMMGSGNSGMGGGMGGFMNVPTPVTPKANAVKGNVYYDVPDTLKPVRKAKKAKKATKDWNAYFRALEGASEERLEESQAEVREAVRKYRVSKNFAGIIDLVNAALLHGQVQTWMYETLAIAMVMDERPADEVERAMTSALEFCNDPNQMLLIGSYLENLGFPQRALLIYEQLGKLFPNDPQPFVFGLKLASRPDVDDVAGIQWASLGLLRQDAGEDRQADWRNAMYSAKAMVERLNKGGKTSEAERFAASLKEALVRDCRITVSWTGDADIDLYVEEPNGSICSQRNRRSAGGGVLTRESASRQTGRDGSARAVETYVCAQGFTGNYNVLVKKMWGEVVGDKVLVDIALHAGTEKEHHIKKVVKLDGDSFGVAFTMTHGRRTDSLQAQRLVEKVKEVKTSQLAKQLVDNLDQKALADYSSTTSGGYQPYYVNGAVGYKPEILWLPEGAQLSAQGVISADRRYVRITASPLFSTIPETRIFNYVTGDTTYEESSSSSSNNSDSSL
ncbi:MAG: hypothetical protein Q4D98_06770 [Planctomycetia bacterium]|nr:hypothetical protein [Planctomycetia bacterium]